MVLTRQDYSNIARMITEGSSSIEYEKNGETLCFDYTLKLYGYVEDDYFNGTGAFVETDRLFNTKDASVINEDGELVPFSINESEIEKFLA